MSEKSTLNGTRHPGKPAYPGPADIQKFEQERKEKQQKKRKEEEETTSQQEEPKSENEQAQTEAKVKSEVSTNVMAHSSSHVQLKPYEPPTGKKALDIWETGFWCNDEMGCCRICQEIGEREPHRKQVRERLFNHRYKSYGKGYLIEVLQVDDDNRADVYHINIGWSNISLVKSGPSPEVLARELRARRAYWKTHLAPRKLEHIKKAAAERKEKLSKLTPEQRQALREYEAAAILSSFGMLSNKY
jgi:hypothetical protein